MRLVKSTYPTLGYWRAGEHFGVLFAVTSYRFTPFMLARMLRIATVLLGLSIGPNHAAAAAPMKRIPVIVDTDIGNDIDDAFAIALIFKSPEIDLLGVTTVSGDTEARALMVGKLLWEEGGKWRGVPIVPGISSNPDPARINLARFTNQPGSGQIRKESAVEFLRREINRYPDQITLIAIGPLSNIANLLRTDPVTAKKIKRIVLMGGSIARGYDDGPGPVAEYNIASDIPAAHAVFAAGIPITMAPLDVTAMLKLDGPARQRIFRAEQPLGSSLAALYSNWGRPTPTLFDVMAVAMLIDPSLCETRELAIQVDGDGITRVAPGKAPNARVGTQVDANAFFAFLMSRLVPRPRSLAAK